MRRRSLDRGALEQVRLLRRSLAADLARFDLLVEVLLAGAANDDEPRRPRFAELPGDRELADDVTRARARAILDRVRRGR